MAKFQRLLVVLSLFFAPAAFAQADQEIVSIVDSPDPVTPGAVLTYTITARNNGPANAVNGGINILLPSGPVTYLNTVAPAGFTCVTGFGAVSCTNPSWAPGTAVFTTTVQVGAHLANFADGSFSTTVTTSGVTPDPNSGNNSQSETTNWDSAQVDLSLTVSDSPDPVGPDQNLTYTVPVTNAGPDTATNVNFNVYNAQGLKFQSVNEPTGWTCTEPAVNAAPIFTCSNPSFAPGTSNFTVVVFVDDAQFGTNEGTISTVFSVNGTGDDTNDGNNQEQEDTAYVTPDADVSVSVVDSPDPVAPDGNITYTVTVANDGPDTAPIVTLSSFGSNNLRFVSASVPAGWNCTLPAAGAQTPGYSCTLAAGMTSGDSDVLTFVMQADDAILGVNDQTIQFGFGANSSVADPVPGNNSETESTQYTTPDADVSVTVTDSPDPVAPDGNITYTVTVANDGPDTAPNVTLSSFGSNNLRFVSASVPAGWNCTLPAAGAQTPGYSCTLAAGMTSGDSDELTFVMQADDAILGVNDQTLQFGFTANSSISDPVPANNSETESTQYSTPDADLSITATDSPDPVTNGSNVTFTVNGANGGPDTATSASVTLAPHPSLTFQSLTAPAGWTCTTPAVDTAGVVQCTRPSFVNAGTAQFTLVTKVVASGAGGTLNSNFTISSSTQDPDQTDNSVTVNTNWIGQSSDLSISKSTLATAAAQGGTITYTISTSNAGPDDATGVTVTDVLPASLRFQSITAPAGWTCTTPAVGANGTVTCTTATFADGATANFTLVTTVAPTATGTISNNATIGAAGSTDPNSGNSSGSSGSVTVAGNADLGVTKSTTSTTVTPGSTVSYTIDVTNAGPQPAASVVMTDVLHASLRFQSITAPAGWSCTTPAVGANGTVTCTASTLASGATATFTLNTTVAAGATGTITNSASASHSGTDGNAGNSSGSSDSVTVSATSADLSIAKTRTTASTTPGSTYAYTIVVANGGPNAASNVTMTDVLPAQLQFVSISSSPAGFTCTTPAVNANGTVTCTAATMASGASVTFTLNVRVNPSAAPGTISNTATVASPTADPDNGDRSSTAPDTTITAGSADLSIVKNTTATTVPANSTFTYTITISNAGPNAAANVSMTDVLPASLLFESIVRPSGFTCTTPAAGANGTVTCTAASLASGANATFTMTVRVAPGSTSGTAINSASVTSTTSDPDNTDTTDAAPPVTLAPASSDVSIDKSTTTTSASPGQIVTWTITVSNAGPSTATNVVVTDTLPAGTSFVSATPSQGTCSGTSNITCSLGNLANGANATITLQATVTATSGTISNTASVATTGDPDNTDNSDTTPPFPVGEPASPAQIPTLSEWALIALAMMIAALAVWKMV